MTKIKKGFSNLFQKKKKKNTKLSLVEIVWFGFNYTVGISFTAVFGSLLFSNNTGLGTNMIWIFLVEGLIAGTCAWAFSRLSRSHPGTNGAAYIYARTSYGRFWGWFISFIQYSTLPVIVTSQIVSIIRINFTDPNSFLYANWGVWSNIGLDLIGMFVYALASCTIFFGIRTFKKFVHSSAYIQWGSTFILMIAVVALFIIAGTKNYSNVIAHQKLTAESFSNAFLSCFFFFLGFETYATIGKNIKNPQKNISRSIVIVMIMATLFYAIVTALMIGAITGGFNDNPNLQIFEEIGDKANHVWLSYAGIIIMLMCTISLKANAGMQNSLYSGGILEPLSIEGYIPENLQKLNKEKIPYRAIIVNIIVTFSFAFIWLIIPDIVQVISDSIHGITKASSVINYSTITGEASLFMTIIYISIMSIALKLSFQKKLRHNKFEIIIWIFGFCFLLWQLIMWFVGLGKGISSSIHDMNSSNKSVKSSGLINLVSNIIQISYITIIFSFAILWYKFYYTPKLKRRLKDGTQKEFDNKFYVHDDWVIVAKSIQDEIDNYLKRNQIIHGGKQNKNYNFAKRLEKEIITSEGSWKEISETKTKKE